MVSVFKIQADRFYCVKEVAAILKVTTRVVYRLIEEGDLPAYKVGRQWRILGADIINFLKNNRSL